MKLASVEIIKNLKPHPNADKIELAQILGWQTVVKKETYKEGDKVIFIVIDSIIPNTEWSAFLQDKTDSNKPIRLKMIKLRGEHSAGVVVPLSALSDSENLEIGTDVTEQLRIKKYIKELPVHLAGENVGDFPSHITSKTDEDNGLSNIGLVKHVLDKGPLTITQKLDGSSVTVIVKNGIISYVCSRNLAKKDTGKSTFWQAAKKLRIPEGFTGIIQGELCGPGIQKNLLCLDEPEIIVFQIKKHNDEYMMYDEMKGFCMVEMACKFVPLVSNDISFAGYSDVDVVIQKLQEMADTQTYNKTEPAEGIVIRPKTYERSYDSRRPMGFKILNRNYNDT
jgi:RNA ligase (TIGR02306 family)